MSRIVVKNLPRSISADKLKEKFSEKGTVTDVQLKYTSEGKFRRFAFIGYHRDDQALAAIDYFNGTFVFNTRIKVEICSNLGDTNKPKSWSKYSTDSNAYQQIHNKDKTKITNDKQDLSKHKKKISNNSKDTKLTELFNKHKDDPDFGEFLEAHGKDASELLSKTDNDHELEGDVEETEKSANIANANISDLEYLKLKTKSSTEKSDVDSVINSKLNKSPNYKKKYFTIVIKNLPPGTKKKDLKAFFKPLPLASVRVPQTFIGMAYIGFKDEKYLNKALNKNKSFWKGKQLNIYKYNHDNNSNDSNNNNNNMKSEKDFKSRKWNNQEESVQHAEDIAESGRIFVRNLSYTVTEDDLQKLFEKYGPLTEVILPIDKDTEKIKGFALITYLMPEHAALAYQNLDGTAFLGRMLHLIPGKAKDSHNDDSNYNEGTSYKTKKAKELKKIAGHVHTWNTLFLGTNAIAEAMAEKYNASKEDIMTGEGAATRLAMGETEIVEKTRAFLEENGVQLDAFNEVTEKRNKKIIIVKNLPFKTKASELKELFDPYGNIGRVLIPPYGITGIVEFYHKSEAKLAFSKLAYKKFKNKQPLYLEWAPEGIFKNDTEQNENNDLKEDIDEINKKENNEEDEEEREPEDDTTLYVKNINFETNEDSMKKHFQKCGSIANITIAKKKDTKNPGQTLSMGYGFVQFYTQKSVDQALKELQNSILDGHQIELKRSNKQLESDDKVVQRKKNNVAKQTGSKILVRNIPFQAKQSEVEELFKAFGDLKFIRLPKKMAGTGSHRGFGFVEFVSKKDAKRAMKTLCQSTHLYGRRLVLEWAEEESDIEILRKRSNRYFGMDTPKNKKSKKGVSDIDVDQYNEDEVDEE